MKRILTLALALILCVLPLCSCGGGERDANTLLVGASITPHADILKQAVPLMADRLGKGDAPADIRQSQSQPQGGLPPAVPDVPADLTDPVHKGKTHISPAHALPSFLLKKGPPEQTGRPF